MEEILDTFAFGTNINDFESDISDNNFEKASQATNIINAKLQGIKASNKLDTNEYINVAVSSKICNEVSCLKFDQENLYLSTLQANVLKQLLESDDPEYEKFIKTFEKLLYQLREVQDENRYWLEKLDKLNETNIGLKIKMKQKQSELDAAMKLKKQSGYKLSESYKSKVRKINKWGFLITELICMSDKQFGENPELVDLLARYRKYYNPDLE